MNWTTKEWVFTQSIKPKGLPIIDVILLEYCQWIVHLHEILTHIIWTILTSNFEKFFIIEYSTLNMFYEFSLIKSRSRLRNVVIVATWIWYDLVLASKFCSFPCPNCQTSVNPEWFLRWVVPPIDFVEKKKKNHWQRK